MEEVVLVFSSKETKVHDVRKAWQQTAGMAAGVGGSAFTSSHTSRKQNKLEVVEA